MKNLREVNTILEQDCEILEKEIVKVMTLVCEGGPGSGRRPSGLARRTIVGRKATTPDRTPDETLNLLKDGHTANIKGFTREPRYSEKDGKKRFFIPQYPDTLMKVGTDAGFITKDPSDTKKGTSRGGRYKGWSYWAQHKDTYTDMDKDAVDKKVFLLKKAIDTVTSKGAK